jgi:hypothetical protein
MVDSRKSRCLILGCSSAKSGSPEPLPAIQRYDGPPFKVLRRYLAATSESNQIPDIFILSAKYGLIGGQTTIASYDQRMTKKRAIAMRDSVLAIAESDLLPQGYSQILLSMGHTYLQAISGLENLVDEFSEIIVSHGPAGNKLTQLRNWLWGISPSPTERREPGLAVAKTTPQTALLRGHTVTLTTDETIERLQGGVALNGTIARQIHHWYVDLNGEKISPKWAAQYLFGVPVNQFSADEARRVLKKLGLNCSQQ